MAGLSARELLSESYEKVLVIIGHLTSTSEGGVDGRCTYDCSTHLGMVVQLNMEEIYYLVNLSSVGTAIT